MKVGDAYIDESEKCVARWLESSASMLALHPECRAVDVSSSSFRGDALCAAIAHGMRALEGLNNPAAEAFLRAAAIVAAVRRGISRHRLEKVVKAAAEASTDEASAERLVTEIFSRAGVTIAQPNSHSWRGVCLFFHAEAFLSWRNVQDADEPSDLIVQQGPAKPAAAAAVAEGAGIPWWGWILGAWILWAVFG